MTLVYCGTPASVHTNKPADQSRFFPSCLTSPALSFFCRFKFRFDTCLTSCFEQSAPRQKAATLGTALLHCCLASRYRPHACLTLLVRLLQCVNIQWQPILCCALAVPASLWSPVNPSSSRSERAAEKSTTHLGLALWFLGLQLFERMSLLGAPCVFP